MSAAYDDAQRLRNIDRRPLIRSLQSLGLMLLASNTVLPAPAGQALLFENAESAAALTDADRRAIYGQLRLEVGPDGNRLVFADGGCSPLQPSTGDIQIATEALNNDQRPEVFVSLDSTCMFGAVGPGIYHFTSDGAGHWQMHNLGTGVYVVQDIRHEGYADLMIGGPGFCQPVLRWDGRTYVFDHNLAEQPGACDGQQP